MNDAAKAGDRRRARGGRRGRGHRGLPGPVPDRAALRRDDPPRARGGQADRADLRRRPEPGADAAAARAARALRRQGDVLPDRRVGRARAGADPRDGRGRPRDRQPHLHAPDDAGARRRADPRGAAALPRGGRGIRRDVLDGRRGDAHAPALRAPAAGHAADDARRGLRAGHLVDHRLRLARAHDRAGDHAPAPSARARATSSCCTTAPNTEPAADRSKSVETVEAMLEHFAAAGLHVRDGARSWSPRALMSELEVGAHAAAVPLVVRARRDRDRDRGRGRLGRAAADVVLQARPARAHLRHRHGSAAADRLPRLRVHDPAADPAPPVRDGGGLDARGRAAHDRDLLRARGRLGLPLVRAQPGLHRPPLPARQRVVVRGAVDLALPARLLPEHRLLSIGLAGARRARRRRREPAVAAPAGCSPGWRSSSRSSSLLAPLYHRWYRHMRREGADDRPATPTYPPPAPEEVWSGGVPELPPLGPRTPSGS